MHQPISRYERVHQDTSIDNGANIAPIFSIDWPAKCGRMLSRHDEGGYHRNMSFEYMNLNDRCGEESDEDENVETLISAIYGGDLARLPQLVDKVFAQRTNFRTEHFSVLFSKMKAGKSTPSTTTKDEHENDDDTEDDLMEDGQCLPNSGIRIYWIENRTYIDVTETQLISGLQRVTNHLEKNFFAADANKRFLENNPNFLKELKKSIRQMKTRLK